MAEVDDDGEDAENDAKGCGIHGVDAKDDGGEEKDIGSGSA